ncbi:MAG: hypothetical protein P4L81_07090 [Candidatus Pacebacteria bacterium]|nr:hypothetical protein [Candidatus Paceibacterota bacterium]
MATHQWVAFAELPDSAIIKSPNFDASLDKSVTADSMCSIARRTASEGLAINGDIEVGEVAIDQGDLESLYLFRGHLGHPKNFAPLFPKHMNVA